MGERRKSKRQMPADSLSAAILACWRATICDVWLFVGPRCSSHSDHQCRSLIAGLALVCLVFFGWLSTVWSYKGVCQWENRTGGVREKCHFMKSLPLKILFCFVSDMNAKIKMTRQNNFILSLFSSNINFLLDFKKPPLLSSPFQPFWAGVRVCSHRTGWMGAPLKITCDFKDSKKKKKWDGNQWKHENYCTRTRWITLLICVNLNIRIMQRRFRQIEFLVPSLLLHYYYRPDARTSFCRLWIPEQDLYGLSEGNTDSPSSQRETQGKGRLEGQGWQHSSHTDTHTVLDPPDDPQSRGS